MARVFVNPKQFRKDLAQELDVHEISSSVSGIHPKFAEDMEQLHSAADENEFAVDTVIESPYPSYFLPVFIHFVKFASVFCTARWLCWRLYTSIQIGLEPTHEDEGEEGQDAELAGREAYQHWLDGEGSYFIMQSPWYRRFDSMLPMQPFEWRCCFGACCAEEPANNRQPGQSGFHKDPADASFAICRDCVFPVLCFRRDDSPPLYRCGMGLLAWSFIPLFAWALAIFGTLGFTFCYLPPLLVTATVDLVQYFILFLKLMAAALVEPIYHCWQRYRVAVQQNELGDVEGFQLVGRLVRKDGGFHRSEVARMTLAKNVSFWKALSLQLDTTHKYMTVYEFLVRNPLWGFFESSIPSYAIVDAWFELVNLCDGELPMAMS
eukprot:gb/GECG01016435.1/.p1 GENE.gb/GECG01016435.1/~~gb/GECG01016435.1/.p1  ORF type:complete len:378 (+),score=37.05 gb/GECG01016435.1/:1-1134(+)